MSIDIEDYHAYRDLLFIGDEIKQSAIPGELYLGVEVETDVREESPARWNTDDLEDSLNGNGFLPLFQPTRDGSLHSGCEFVSYPLTIKAWMDRRELIKESFKALVDSGLRAHETMTCGLHVHASSILDGSQKDVLGVLIENNWPAITTFSRRGINDRYAKKQVGISSDGKMDRAYKEAVLDQSYRFNRRDRYCALNLQGDDTIEFRMFKGTLNPNTFFATIQFVYNCMRVATHLTLKQAFQHTIFDIIEYHKWPELTKYVATRDFTSNTLATWADNGEEE